MPNRFTFLPVSSIMAKENRKREVKDTDMLQFEELKRELEEQEEALTKIIIFLAGLVPVDHLKGLEQAAISKRAERLKEYKEYIEDLPEKDAKRILKELAILEKIRAQK